MSETAILQYTEPANVQLVADSPGYKAFEAKIRAKLTELKDYCEEVLPEYIMVMINHNKPPRQMVDDLVDFLGENVAVVFTNWLWSELGALAAEIAAQQQQQQQQQVAQVNNGQQRLPGSVVLSSVVETDDVNMDAVNAGPGKPVRSRMLLGALNSANRSVKESHLRPRNVENERGGRRGNQKQPPPNRAQQSRDQRRVEYEDETAVRRDRAIREARGMEVDVEEDGRQGQWKRDRAPRGGGRLAGRLGGRMGGTDQGRSGRRDSNGGDLPRSLASRLEDNRTYDENGRPIMDIVKLVPMREVTKRVRCSFWPTCQRGDACEYHHPKDPCRNFPACQFGSDCLYVHPSVDCKFSSSCSRFDCKYNHPSRATQDVAKMMMSAMGGAPGGAAPGAAPHQTVPACRFGSDCTNKKCHFAHPTVACKNGADCKFGKRCLYSHRPECKFGAKCKNPACHFAHPARFGGSAAPGISNGSDTAAAAAAAGGMSIDPAAVGVAQATADVVM